MSKPFNRLARNCGDGFLIVERISSAVTTVGDILDDNGNDSVRFSFEIGDETYARVCSNRALVNLYSPSETHSITSFLEILITADVGSFRSGTGSMKVRWKVPVREVGWLVAVEIDLPNIGAQPAPEQKETVASAATDIDARLTSVEASVRELQTAMKLLATQFESLNGKIGLWFQQMPPAFRITVDKPAALPLEAKPGPAPQSETKPGSVASGRRAQVQYTRVT